MSDTLIVGVYSEISFLADFGYAPRYPICLDRYGLERVNFYLPLIRRQSEL